MEKGGNWIWEKFCLWNSWPISGLLLPRKTLQFKYYIKEETAQGTWSLANLSPESPKGWWKSRKLICKFGEWGTPSPYFGCKVRSSLTFPLKSVLDLVSQSLHLQPNLIKLQEPPSCSGLPQAHGQGQLPAAASAQGTRGTALHHEPSRLFPLQSPSSLKNCELYLLLDSGSPRSRCQGGSIWRSHFISTWNKNLLAQSP